MQSKRPPRLTVGQRAHLQDRRDYMRRVMRKLALTFDADARFTVLANNLGVHVNAITRWIDKGYMPMTTARGLESRFGTEMCNAAELAER